jgi:hypothetical protein
MVGFLLNVLPVRGDLSGAPTFREVVRRTRDRLLAAYEHQEPALHEVVRTLGPRPDGGHHPLVRALFAFATARPAVDLSGLRARVVLPEITTAKYDLALSLRQHNGTLLSEITSDTALFGPRSAAAFAEAFGRVVQQARSDVDPPVKSLAEDVAPLFGRDTPLAAAPLVGVAAPYVEPVTSTERHLAAIWAEELGVERVGADDNFFLRGGHSVLALRVTGRVRDAFSVDLPVNVIFESPTMRAMAAMAARIDGAAAGDGPS